MIRPSLLAALIGAAVLAAGPAAADDALLLGVSRDWSAFSTGTGADKTCYAMSKPTASTPRKIKRDPIYFLITDWPARKTKSEPEAVPGYQYKDGSTVTAQVGGASFEFFTQNDGGAGAAWIRKRTDEVKLVEAMRNGQSLVVTGTSKRGTLTTDTYSLAGLGDALDRIHRACGL
ncbi:MAG: invasion associated locus B family protein [Rhizomicrobium sp.]